MRPFLIALLVLCAAAPAFGAEPTPSPTPKPKRGFATPDRATAEAAIRFRPFVPDVEIQATSLQPPFHGEQISSNEGIAYTYERAGRTWILTQWPRNGGKLDRFGVMTDAEKSCRDSHAIGGTTKPRGIVWTTPRNLVMALMPDGHAPRSAIIAEQRRLARRGACR